MRLNTALSTALGLAIAVLFIAPSAHAWGPRDGYSDGRNNTYHGPARVDVPPPLYDFPNRYPQSHYSDYRTYPSYPSYSPYPSYPSYRHYPYHRVETPSYGWREGRWSHERHNNQLGWWWVSALGWSLFSAPSYPYPEPQTTIIYEQPTVTYTAPAPVVHLPPPPPSGSSVKIEISTNDSISGASTPPADGRYYFCTSSQLYYPNTPSCSERWKIVLASDIE